MAMKAAACLSGMLARQRARRSAPPSLTTSIARRTTYSFVPIGTSTTVTSHPSTMQTSKPSWSEISVVRACAFGGSATVLAVVPTMPMLCSARRRKKRARTVLAVIPIRSRERLSMITKTSTPSLSTSSRKRFSPGHHATQTEHCRPHGVPLLDTIAAGDHPGLLGIHPENTSAGLVP